MSELARRAVRGTLAVGVANTVSRAVGFAGALYLMEAVSQTSFGLVGFALAVLTVLSALSDWGFAHAATHRRERVDETFATYLVLRIGFFALLLGLVGLVALAAPGLLADRTEPAVLAALAGAVLLDAAAEAPATRLSRDLRFARLVGVDVTCTILATGVGVVLAALGFGVWALVANRAVHAVTRLGGLLLVSVEPVRLGFHATDARWLLRFGRPLWLGGLATAWVLQYDDLVVGSRLGATVLGYYDRAYSLALVPLSLVTGVLTRVSFPLYAHLQHDRERLSAAFRIASGTTLRLAGPAAAAMALALPDVFAMLGWTAKWGPAVPLFRWLLVYTLVRPMLDDAGGLLTAVGRPRVTGHTLVAQAAALVVLCPLLTWWRGAEGAAMSVGLVVLAGLVVWYAWFVPQVVDVAWLRLLGGPLVSLAAGSGAAVAATWLGEFQPGLAACAVKLGMLVAVYLTVLLLLDGRQTMADLRALKAHAIGDIETRG